LQFSQAARQRLKQGIES